MTSHEIYIDGHLIDLSDDFDVALLFQSWFFQEITSIASNRSYTAKIPPTPRNILAIGYSSFEEWVDEGKRFVLGEMSEVELRKVVVS